MNATLEAALRALNEAGVPDANTFAALAEPTVRITARGADLEALGLGVSRFGGAPDVPPGFRWPTRDERPLTFLAQIDLAEAAAPGLPARGWLLFFYDAQEQPWGFDPNDAGGAVVRFVEGERAELRRQPHPAVDAGAGPFKPCATTLVPGVDLPDAGDGVVEAAFPDSSSVPWESYDRAVSLLAGGLERDGAEPVRHHLLGHPQIVQGDMRAECQLAANGIYAGDPSGYESPRATELCKTAAADWQLLMQIDTDEDGPGWMWGDCGRLYYWIRKRDLAERAFDKVWLILQCG
jgi:uncharacterized protein YwqG